MWHCGVGCNPRVCWGNSLCSVCGSTFLTGAPDVLGRSSELKQQFLFPHFTGRPHTSVIGARNLCLGAEPKGAFLWGLQTLLPDLPPALFCLSCQISLHSLPPGQVILVPSLLLGKETHVQLSIFKWLFFPAACFPSGSLSSHHPCSLALPSCLWQPLARECRLPGQGSALPWRSHCPGCLSPSHTELTSCFLFVFSSSSLFVELGVTSVTHLLSVSSFLLLFSAVDLFIVWDRLLYLFHVDCFSNKAVAQCC